VKRLTLAVVFLLTGGLLTGCGTLVIEQRMVKLDTDVRAIQQDFRALSATFTPEQREKCARARAAQDESTFQEFYSSLDAQQKATMTALLDRAHQVVQEHELLGQVVQQDLARQEAERQRLPRGFWIVPANSVL
jgi:hypothetical protein